ncbi:MAG: LCP family protein [Anaerolineales bacterium]
MTKTQRNILLVLTVIACGLSVFVIALGYQAYQVLWEAPLMGPAIAMETTTPLAMPPTWTASPPGLSGQPGTPTLAETATPVAAPRCGGPPVMTILAVGSDARSNSYNYGLGDVIRVVRVDFVNARVTILTFPRDLWVEIPDIADNLNGQTHEKLNQAYLYGNPGFGYYEGPGAGPGLMARTLALNFGVVPERYIGVNMRTFEQIVDAVGGIDIYLPRAVDGRTSEDRSSRLVFPAGQQHLNGPQALTLARIRIDGVFDRMDNQNLVMCALKDKLTSPKVITSIPALINSFKDNVQTDLTPEQLTQLACIGTQIKSEDIIFASFPEELFTQARQYDPVFKGRVFIWDADYDVLRDYVKRFNEGTWPAPDMDEEDPETTSTCP